MPTQRTRTTRSTRLVPDVEDAGDDALSARPLIVDPTAPVRVRTSAGARPAEPRWARCRTCRHLFVAASLVAGDCPGCAGLVPLPLAGEDGRWIPGMSHGSPSPSRPIAPSRTRDDVR